MCSVLHAYYKQNEDICTSIICDDYKKYVHTVMYTSNGLSKSPRNKANTMINFINASFN